MLQRKELAGWEHVNLVYMWNMVKPQIKYDPAQTHGKMRTAGVHENPKQLKPLGDAELLDLASAGNRQAMAEIYDRHSHLCYAIALRILNSASAAESVVRDAFLEIWRQPRTFRVQNCLLPAWLATVTRMRALAAGAVSGQRRTDELLLPGADELSLAMAQDWRLEKLKRAVTNMPPTTRQALDLAWYQGTTPEAMAGKMGISVAAAQEELETAIGMLEKALLAHE